MAIVENLVVVRHWARAKCVRRLCGFCQFTGRSNRREQMSQFIEHSQKCGFAAVIRANGSRHTIAKNECRRSSITKAAVILDVDCKVYICGNCHCPDPE